MESLSLYHLDEGNTHLINQQYKASIQCYTSCIESTAIPPTNDDGNDDGNVDGNDNSQIEFIAFRAYSHRAESHLRLKEYTKAKDDILKSHSVILSSSQNDKHRDEIGMSFVRLGKACFELKEYKSSLESFDRATEELSILGAADADADSDADADVSLGMKTVIQDYRKQCEKELEKLPVTIGHIPSTTETKPTSKPTLPTLPTTTETTTRSNIMTNKQPTCPKYQYYQNDNFMTIQILEPNLDATKVKVEFTLDKLTVIVQKGGKNFTVICGTLFSAVVVSKCKVKYMSEKVLIKLKKKHKHDWHTLFGGGAQDEDKEEEEQRLQAERAAVASAAAITTNDTAPTGGGNDTAAAASSSTKPTKTPYASNKDWNSIEKELKHDEENEKPEGEGAFQKFLKSMYKDADADTRRAMIKSYQTSGGTHLSCNWNDVAKTDYEKQRTAPNGQEWRNWEGDKLPMKDDD